MDAAVADLLGGAASVKKRRLPGMNPSSGALPSAIQALEGSRDSESERPTNSTKPKGPAAPFRAKSTYRTGWREMAHWGFLLALIPLVLHTLVELGGESPGQKIRDRVKALGDNPDEEAVQAVLSEVMSESKPFLEEDSLMHWPMGVLSAVAFLAILVIFSDDPRLKSWHLLAVGAATGTAGILILFAWQFLAFNSLGLGIRLRGGWLAIIFFLFQLIGLAYICALAPGMPFPASLFGFTIGVGLCEELIKGIAIAVYLKSVRVPQWRIAYLVGLASGIGFGVSEGIHYSGQMYNGLTDWSIYPVRFVSCVALHAIWSGCVALMMYRNQETLFEEFSFGLVFMFIVQYLIGAMILHGLYDTFLKHDMNIAALLIAGASFGWMAYLVDRQRFLGD